MAMKRMMVIAVGLSVAGEILLMPNEMRAMQGNTFGIARGLPGMPGDTGFFVNLKSDGYE